jgi:hypothetical protein
MKNPNKETEKAIIDLIYLSTFPLNNVLRLLLNIVPEPKENEVERPAYDRVKQHAKDIGII